MSPSKRLAICLLTVALHVAGAHAQQVTPDSAAATGELQHAVELTLAAMKPHQKSLVRGTAKDSLPLLMGEWGSDIQELVGLAPRNTRLAAALCQRVCSVEQATLQIMESVHEVLLRTN